MTGEEGFDLQTILGDIGNIDIPDIDLALFDIGEEPYTAETRYLKAKAKQVKNSFVTYENAIRLAKRTPIDKNERVDVFVSGNFIFGDYIEAFLTTHHTRAEEMTISTLSMSQNNIDSLKTLMMKEYIGNLNIVMSSYFYSHEAHNLVKYMLHELDIDNRLQIAVAAIHTKTVHFATDNGKKIVMHGSANLRSCANIEQFTIEENEDLYDFYNEHFRRIIDEYKIINKAIKRKDIWNIFTQK